MLQSAQHTYHVMQHAVHRNWLTRAGIGRCCAPRFMGVISYK
jgi:hypothetical protein